MKNLLCFGLGYSASALARLVRPAGWRVTGTSTSAEGAERGRALTDAMFVFDGRRREPALAAATRAATHVLISPAPTGEGDPVLAVHADDLAAAPHLQWIGYLSTVGVYGDAGGAWVDETTACKPTSERSRRRVAAENQWLEFAARTGRRVQIFRLAGIYGPGRSAIDNLRDGSARRIIKPGQVFNRIHVDDIARVLAAAMDGKGRHTVYNVTDDEPCPPQDVVAFAAGLIGMEVPPDIPFETADLSPMGRSFYGENKRVSNARLHEDFPGALQLRTYREGMAAVAQAAHKPMGSS